MKKLAAAAALGLVALGAADQAAAGVTFTGQFGSGNTWNVYEAINAPFTFKDALAFAPTRANPVTGNAAVGHLVTLSNLAENNFVYTTGGSLDRWIGLTDRVGVAPGASESQFTFFPGPLHEGWAWVTGEPYRDSSTGLALFENWQRDAMGVPTEPNNSGGTEDAAHIWGGGFWNDNASGFGQDDPVPDTVTFDSPAEGLTVMGFIIEWETRLASEPAGFPMTRPDPPPPPLPPIPRVFPTPLARLPGPDGTASAFGVLDVTGSASADTRAAITNVLSGGGTRVEGMAARFDINDPENGGNQGSVPAPQVPIPSNTPGPVPGAGDNNNFQEVVKGTFQVPAGQGGLYTFNVRSDDGFAMRIISQASGGPVVQHQFTNSRTGRVDEDGALVFLAPTGDSNTQGVIDLAQGTYDVEFVWFENGGGAFAEVSTAKGDFVNAAPNTAAQWILLGDNLSFPESGPFAQPARLTGNATVKNNSRGTITNVAQIVTQYRDPNSVPTAEGTVDEVVLKDTGAICCGRPGGGLPADQQNVFPNGGGDQFTTQVTGQFQVLDTNGASGETLTFGLFADDNAALHLLGQSFAAAGGGGSLGNPEGMADQWLIADFRTGNTNAFGLITLAEGTYNFEAFQLEEGGDAGLEVFVAAGDLMMATGYGPTYDPARYFPLTTASLATGTVVLAANRGLPLVMGPGTGPAAGLAGDYNNDGKVDAADYVVWRKTDGSPAGYNTWRMNFGRTAGSGLGAGAVPEPGSALLTVVGLIGGAWLMRRRGAPAL